LWCFQVRNMETPALAQGKQLHDRGFER
jgi:hypothetical protein